MDITNLFRSRVDFIRNRNKALGTILSDSSPKSNISSSLPTNNHHNAHPSKSKIFPGKKSEYYTKAKDITGTITSLKTFLTETRSHYLSINSAGTTRSKILIPSGSGGDTMSENEKDQIDSTVQKIIQNTQKKIFELKTSMEVGGVEQNHPQLFAHLENVINSLVAYLKQTCELYSEMRAIRVKRTVDIQAMSKISHGPGLHQHQTTRKHSMDSLDSRTFKDIEESNRGIPKPKKPDSSEQESLYGMYDDEELSPEELQLFNEENAQLLNDLNTIAEEADQIETSVVKIAQLQEIFTEKVLLQDKEISHISNVVIGTTENIKGGNEQIRQAIQQNADFRAWVLFFIIVMSLSLLFLDWYND